MSNTRMSAGNYSETSAEPVGYHVGGVINNDAEYKAAPTKDSELVLNYYFTGKPFDNMGTFLANLFLDDLSNAAPVNDPDNYGIATFKTTPNSIKTMNDVGVWHAKFTPPGTFVSGDLSNAFETKYFDAAGKPDFTTAISDKDLKKAYTDGLSGVTPAPAPGAASADPNFGPKYKFDEISTKEFLEKLKKATVEPVAKNYALDLSNVIDAAGNKITKSVSDLITGTRWVRTGANTYNMITKDEKTGKDSKTKPIKIEGDDIGKLIESCFGTYITDDACKDTLLKIILADDGSKITDSSGNEITIDDKVKEIMETPLGQFAWMGEEISKIYPVIALKVLHRFGFREHTVPDANSDRDIRKIEDASHWLQSDHLEKKFGKEAINTMLSKNMTLVYYLDLVSEFVNRNSTILNPDYVGSDGEGDSSQSQYTKDLGIKQRRERKDGDVGRLRSYIQHSRQFTSFPFMTPGLQQTLSLGKPVLTPVRTGQGLGTMYGPGRLTPFSSRYVTPGLSSMYARSDGGQFGGGDGGSSYGVRQFDDGEQGSRFGAKFIKKVFDNSLSSLKAKHKTIANEKQIKETLDDIIKKEDEVFKSVALIEWYNNLMNVTNNQKTETVSASKMQALIDRHQKLVKGYHSQEDVMLKILENLYTLKGDSDYVPIDFSA